ncbi:hypothetical protein DBA20_20610 [Pandoraea capi]|nr:hypothetical protein [Pandoraea sp. LA3]MDN4585379.1 hypothetical protein [Pandoraea capi]
MPDVGLPTLSSATTDAIASSTPTLENTWHAQGNDALHPSIVQRSIVKRITTGNRSTGRRLGYFRVSKYADVIRSIPKEEYARLGGLTGVALAYGVPRASLSQYVNADGELRDLGRARLDRTEHAFSLANLRQLQANGPALCAAAGGFAQLAVRLGVHANQLREVLTVDGKLRLRGRRRLNDNAELVSRTPYIPDLSNVRGANDTRDPVPTVVLHWYPGTQGEGIGPYLPASMGDDNSPLPFTHRTSDTADTDTPHTIEDWANLCPGTPDVHSPAPSDLLFESEFADGSDAWIDRLLNRF